MCPCMFFLRDHLHIGFVLVKKGGSGWGGFSLFLEFLCWLVLEECRVVLWGDFGGRKM